MYPSVNPNFPYIKQGFPGYSLCSLINMMAHHTFETLFNTVHYNMVLDITRFKDGSQKCIDYIHVDKRSRRTCIAPLACIHMIFKQGIAGHTNPLAQIYL